jgi:hypothetical protein
MHRGISFAVAALFVPGGMIFSFWASLSFFDWKYPHDGMNGLGAIFASLIGGFVAAFPAVCAYTLLLRALSARAQTATPLLGTRNASAPDPRESNL